VSDPADRISARKLEHLEMALGSGVEGPSGPGWGDVHLVHDCLPEIDFAEIDLTTYLLGQQLRAPLWITGMTGGHERSGVINERLARAAEKFGIAMGLGSQRAGLVDDRLMRTYRVAREVAPNAILVANIGAPQLVPQGTTPPLTIDEVQRIIDAISAQALAIHLNFLQEVMQPEGDRNARGVVDAIARIVESVGVPVLVKETGAGISKERAADLKQIGVAAIDVAGTGGTSFVRMEGRRAESQGDGRALLAQTFDGWGIPTAAAVLETRGAGLPVIATGGVRSGLDAARAIAIGATAVGVGRPFLLAADEGEEALDAAISRFIEEIRVALFLTGSPTPNALRDRGAVILGGLRSWADQRARA
jgi:isopentenyl-diphosphate delta-isomerase